MEDLEKSFTFLKKVKPFMKLTRSLSNSHLNTPLTELSSKENSKFITEAKPMILKLLFPSF